MHAQICSCGKTSRHIIARRQTADGTTVVLLDNGAITSWSGTRIPGIPVARPSTPAAKAIELRAAWMFLGEVEMYDAAEIGPLHAACRSAARDSGGIDLARAYLRAPESAKLPRLEWRVLSTDRDGTPTERFAALPRLFWGGWGVFDFCGRAGSARGRYQVADVDRNGTAWPTGLAFSTLTAMWKHLNNNRLDAT